MADAAQVDAEGRESLLGLEVRQVGLLDRGGAGGATAGGGQLEIVDIGAVGEGLLLRVLDDFLGQFR